MIRIAVTGGIACGKSTVANMLSETGVPVCDADDLSREVLAYGSPQLRQVRDAFGASVMLPDGRLNRPALAQRVFRDRDARLKLEQIVHPVVVAGWTRWLQEQQDNAATMAAVVIPLLFEGDFTEGWHRILCVTATTQIQLERLTSRGLSTEDALLRMDAQLSLREKERRSDLVIINNASMAVLRRQLDKLLKHIVEIAE